MSTLAETHKGVYKKECFFLATDIYLQRTILFVNIEFWGKGEHPENSHKCSIRVTVIPQRSSSYYPEERFFLQGGVANSLFERGLSVVCSESGGLSGDHKTARPKAPPAQPAIYRWAFKACVCPNSGFACLNSCLNSWTLGIVIQIN